MTDVLLEGCWRFLTVIGACAKNPEHADRRLCDYRRVTLARESIFVLVWDLVGVHERQTYIFIVKNLEYSSGNNPALP